MGIAVYAPLPFVRVIAGSYAFHAAGRKQ